MAKEGVDMQGLCLHCNDMSRSHPLAQCSVFSVPCSARHCSGSSMRLLPLASPRVAGAMHHSPRSLLRSPSAFTLIELLVVIAIIAILAGLTLGTLGYVNKKCAESRARAEVAALSAAIDAYKLEYGTYPADQASLFNELLGKGTVNTNKLLFETTASMGTNTKFIDPWGDDYVYNTNATYNVGFFDLYSKAGTTNTNNWIRN